MKRVNVILILTILLNMVSNRASAFDFEADGINYNIVSIGDLTCEIAPGYSLYSGDFVIPNEVQYNGKTLKVVQIGRKAFFESRVTSVTIPDGITTIGSNAFSKCARLESIQISNSVESIGSYAFSECKSLSTISLPNSLREIGDYTFSGCTSLTQISIPNGLSGFGNYTFRGCSSLTDVEIPQSVVSIGKSAFEDCKALPQINLSEGIEKIDESAFKNCIALESFTIPASCNEIRNYAFNGCKKLKKLVIKDGLTTLMLGFSYIRNDNADYYNDLFSNDYNYLDTLYLGRIAKRALEWLPYKGYGFQAYGNYGIFGKELKSLTIGDNITDDIYDSNERYLFFKTNSGGSITPYYNHITFGKGLTRIPDFSHNHLSSIVVRNENPPTAVGFANMTYLNCKLYVPKGCKAAYESADVWKNFWNIIELEQDINTLGIETHSISSEVKETTIYSIMGTKAVLPQRGINVIKMSDGTVKKVLIK